jgi:hypothetical protein
MPIDPKPHARAIPEDIETNLPECKLSDFTKKFDCDVFTKGRKNRNVKNKYFIALPKILENK